jgi:Tol biopolymer transport system component
LSGRNRFPTWTSDSTRITFQSDREGDAGIFWQRIDDGKAERLTRSESNSSHIPESWSPDGKTLLFAVARDGRFALHAYSRPEQQIKRFGDVHSIYAPASEFSPDGQWVVYYSRPLASTSGSVIVQSFASPGTKHEVYSGGGIHPMWSLRQGRLQLLYRLPQRIETVEVTTRPTFGFTKAVALPWQQLFNDDPETTRRMDVTPDGEHFIAVDQASQSEVREDTGETIHVVLNWFSELQQRVPTR